MRATLAVTSWSGPGAAVLAAGAVVLPGYPVTDLSDASGPWAEAWGAAVELGGDRQAFWPAIAEHGLLAPAAWLGRDGWPSAWARAQRQR